MSIDNQVVIALNILQYTKVICNVLYGDHFASVFSAICLPGCHPDNGICRSPNECKYVYIQAHLSISILSNKDISPTTGRPGLSSCHETPDNTTDGIFLHVQE